MWVDLGVGVGLRSGRGLILPARGDFAQGGLRFLSRCRSGLGVVVCILVSAWWWSRGCGCGVADLGWVWWFAFWSRRGGGAVDVVVGLPVD